MSMYTWNTWYVILFYLWLVSTILLFTGFSVMLLKTVWRGIKETHYSLSGKPILLACSALLSAFINPLTILMVRESIAVITFRNKVLERVFDIWSILLSVILMLLVGLLAIAIWQAIIKKRFCVFPLITLLVCSVMLTILVNPICNFLIFDSVTQAAHDDMWRSLKTDNIIGKSTEILLERYGKPRRIGGGQKDGTWYYYPGPWYAAKWITILINVRDGRIVEYFWDD